MRYSSITEVSTWLLRWLQTAEHWNQVTIVSQPRKTLSAREFVFSKMNGQYAGLEAYVARSLRFCYGQSKDEKLNT